MPQVHDEALLQADPTEVERLLALAAEAPDLPRRLDAIAAALMDRPYVAGSLVGGPAEPERLVTRLDAFDCVTYCDSVMALAAARDPAELPARVRALRYHRGRLGWRDRNHYTHSWLARNWAAGLLEPLLPELWEDAGTPRTLDILEGYPALRWQPCYLPWTPACRSALEASGRAGDWLGFISHRPCLDTFHVGMLVVDGELCVRHASQSRGRVILEPLHHCMQAWDVPGLLVARPLPTPSHPSPGEPS